MYTRRKRTCLTFAWLLLLAAIFSFTLHVLPEMADHDSGRMREEYSDLSKTEAADQTSKSWNPRDFQIDKESGLLLPPKIFDEAVHQIAHDKIKLRFPNLKSMVKWTKAKKKWANTFYYPWYQEKDNGDPCFRLPVSFAPEHSLPIVGLASYPNSGNSWARYLIQGVTGYFTGSMYDDYVLPGRGYYGENLPYHLGMTVVVKSHGYTTGPGAQRDRSWDYRRNYTHFEELNHTAILLVRDPFAAIIGHRHLDTGGHTGYAPMNQFEGAGWDEFVRIKIDFWEHFHLDWLQDAPASQLLILHYEHLKSDLRTSLGSVLEFLGLPVDEERLECTLAHSQGLVKRKKLAKLGDPFTEGQKVIVREAIDRVNLALRDRNREALPLERYLYYYTT